MLTVGITILFLVPSANIWTTSEYGDKLSLTITELLLLASSLIHLILLFLYEKEINYVIKYILWKSRCVKYEYNFVKSKEP